VWSGKWKAPAAARQTSAPNGGGAHFSSQSGGKSNGGGATFQGIPVNPRTGGYPEYPDQKNSPSIPGSAYDNVLLGGYGGGGGTGQQTRGRSNGGGASFGGGFGLGSMAAAFVANGKRNLVPATQMDSWGQSMALSMNGPHAQGNRFAAVRGTFGNAYRSTLGVSDSAAAGNSALTGFGAAYGQGNFAQLMGKANNLAALDPTNGLSPVMQGMAALQTPSSYWALRTMGFNYNRQNGAAGVTNLYHQIINRSMKPGQSPNMSVQGVNSALAAGGGLNISLGQMEQAGAITPELRQNFERYVRAGAQARAHGFNIDTVNANTKAGQSQLKSIGLDKSMFESMRNNQNNITTRQAGTLDTLSTQFQDASAALGKFQTALTKILELPGIKQIVSGGTAWSSVFSGAAGMAGSVGGGMLGALGMGRMLGGGGGLLGGLGRGGGLLGGLGGALDLSAPALLGGGAFALAGLGAGSIVKHVIGGKKGSTRQKVGSTLGDAAAGAGIGAAVGSVVPILGTGVGAAIGGGLGALKGSGILNGIFGGGGPGTGGQNKQATGGASSGHTGADAVRIAEGYLGTPYQWGGNAPGGFDCSGLVQWSYKQLGVNLPRTAAQQEQAGKAISRSQLQVGDLVFYGNPAEHVGIYVGNGKMVDAPHTGASVRVENLWGGESGFRRIVGSAGVLNNQLGGSNTAGSNTNSLSHMGGQGQGNIGMFGMGTSEASIVSAALAGMGGPSPYSGNTGQSSGGGNGNSGSTSSSGPISGTVADWAKAGLALAKKPASWLAGMVSIAMHESGGRNIAQQISDINSQNGNGAFGPWQMIQGTFMANAVKGHTNWRSPIDEAASAANYIASRYGDPNHTPGLVSLAQGGSYKGYAVGSWELVRDEIAQLHKGEMVLPAKTAAKVRDLINQGQPTGPTGTGQTVLQFNQGSVVFQVSGVMDEATVRIAADMFVSQVQRDDRLKQIASA
jgi:cell wall-associated NlpC family hydrolase